MLGFPGLTPQRSDPLLHLASFQLMHCAAAFPDDDLRSEQKRAGRNMIIAKAFAHGAESGSGDFLAGLFHRGKRRCEGFGELDVVKAYQRHIGRNADSEEFERFQEFLS